MSYTRRYTEKIAVKYSGSVRYPASQNGGTQQYSGIAYEEVDVVVEVDTGPFDKSVDNCNTNVNLLTGAVVATEAAQIASKKATSERIANTIVKGFFGLIRSEISQQIAELRQGIESQSMHLAELSKSLVDKKRQMEADFTRISSRYVKIFDDLNNELSNRVHELDKPTFLFCKELDNQHLRASCNDMVNTVAVFGKEGGQIESKIGASIVKKKAEDALKRVKTFLLQQKLLDSAIQRSMSVDAEECRKYVPVCFIESGLGGVDVKGEVYCQSFIKSMNDKRVKEILLSKYNDSSMRWVSAKADMMDSINAHFNDEMKNAYPKNDLHSSRVREMIRGLHAKSEIKTFGS